MPGVDLNLEMAEDLLRKVETLIGGFLGNVETLIGDVVTKIIPVVQGACALFKPLDCIERRELQGENELTVTTIDKYPLGKACKAVSGAAANWSRKNGNPDVPRWFSPKQASAGH